MQVYEVEVTFMRKRQPKEYENAQSQVTLKASLEDGEDYENAMSELMSSAASHVYSQLGLNVAQGTQSATATKTDSGAASKSKPGPKKGTTKKQEAAEDVPDNGGEEAPANDVPDETPAEAPKKTAPKKQAESSGGGDSVSHGDVQGLISKMVKEKVCSVQDCKGILKEYGVDRTQDLPADKLSEVKDRIEALGL